MGVLEVGQDDETYNDYYVRTGWDHETYFRNIPRAMFTLFQTITLDCWAEDVVRHISENSGKWAIVFPVWLLSTTYGLCYAIIGIIVDSTLQVQEENKALHVKRKKVAENKITDQLKGMFVKMDENGDGMISLKELKAMSHHPEIRVNLKAISFPVDEPDGFFHMIDHEGRGEVEVEDFVRNVLRLSTGPLRAKDMLEAEKCVEQLGIRLRQVEDKFLISGDRIRRLDEKSKMAAEHIARICVKMKIQPKKKKDMFSLDA